MSPYLAIPLAPWPRRMKKCVENLFGFSRFQITIWPTPTPFFFLYSRAAHVISKICQSHQITLISTLKIDVWRGHLGFLCCLFFGVFFRYFLAVFHANVSPLCSEILEVSELLLEPNVMVNLKSSVYIFLRSLESSLIFRKLIFYLVSKFFSLLQGKSIRLEKCTKHMFQGFQGCSASHVHFCALWSRKFKSLPSLGLSWIPGREIRFWLCQIEKVRLHFPKEGIVKATSVVDYLQHHVVMELKKE